MRIAVIDENLLNRKVLLEFLQQLGHEVSNAGSVSKFEQANTQALFQADIIIIDPEAPKGHAMGIIHKIHEILPSADILIMSNGQNVLDFDDAVSENVFAYLKKPVILAELELLITRISEKRLNNS